MIGNWFAPRQKLSKKEDPSKHYLMYNEKATELEHNSEDMLRILPGNQFS